MEYTSLMLLGLGLLGILIHNLTKIKEANDKTNGNFDAKQFFKMEWPTILISISVVFVCLIAKSEVKELELAGNYLGLGFVAIGYFGQSMLYKYFGRVEKKIKADDANNNTTTP